MPFPFLFCANFLLPDNLLFGFRGELKVFKGVMRLQEGGSHRGRKWNVNLTSPGSAVSLVPLPTEEQAAPVIPELSTSGRACQSARQSAGEGRRLATGKGQPASPKGRLCAAVRIPDPHPIHPQACLSHPQPHTAHQLRPVKRLKAGSTSFLLGQLRSMT